MKKILGLGLVAMLVMAMVGGGTWAYFSDVQTSSGNILTAGTLDIGLGNSLGAAGAGSDATATWTSPTGWKPGDNVTQTLYLKNIGTIAMSSVNITFGHIFTEGTPATVNGNFLGDPTDNITKMISLSVATWNGTATSFQGDSLLTVSGNGTMNLGSLSAQSSALLNITWLFSTAATNGCQGDSENVTLTVTATQ